VRHAPVPNVFFGAVQYLLASEPAHALAAHYPTLGGRKPGGDPGPLLREFCRERRAALAPLLRERRTQTHEVRRCALLLPLLARVEAESGQGLALLEAGACMGLCLWPDRYNYAYGASRLEVAKSWTTPLLECELRGFKPPARIPRIDHRAGADLEPVSARDGAALRWLEALVWPEFPERVARLRQAAAIAARERPVVERADALQWLGRAVVEAPAASACVVQHAMVLNQLGEAGRARFEETLRGASRARTLWQAGLESDVEGARVELWRYASGESVRLFTARCHPHGAWMGPESVSQV
jgi:hypothetical protein